MPPRPGFNFGHASRRHSRWFRTGVPACGIPCHPGPVVTLVTAAAIDTFGTDGIGGTTWHAAAASSSTGPMGTSWVGSTAPPLRMP
jgi:hypothetical protein